MSRPERVRASKAAEGSDAAEAAEAELRRWLRAAARQLPAPVLERFVHAMEPGQRMTAAEHWPLWRLDGQFDPRATGGCG